MTPTWSGFEAIPRTWTRNGLQRSGYEGFHRFSELPQLSVPKAPGVYVVLRRDPSPPDFLDQSRAGKTKDATADVGRLRAEWVDGAEVVYIGKAGSGSRRDGLHRRLRQYRRTGEGRADNHMGGVWIWQLADSHELQVCWYASPGQTDEFVAELEHLLIADFTKRFGCRPFANRID